MKWVFCGKYFDNSQKFQYTCNGVINSHLNSAFDSEIIYRVIHLKILRKTGLKVIKFYSCSIYKIFTLKLGQKRSKTAR